MRYHKLFYLGAFKDLLHCHRSSQDSGLPLYDSLDDCVDVLARGAVVGERISHFRFKCTRLSMRIKGEASRACDDVRFKSRLT